MTPEREKYLAECSEREKELRLNINKAKLNLSIFKMAVTKQGMLPILKKSIKSTKCKLVAYRHELHRLKGMNNVVVPKRIFIDNYCGISTKCTRCKCGRLVPDFKNYCSDCGRHILWEKVK